MSEVIRFALLGLATGAMYALASQGLILVYRGSGVLNFAHGAMAMLAAFIFFDLRDGSGWPFLPAFVLCLGIGALVGVLIHVVVMRRLATASGLMRLIATLGVLAVIQAAARLHWGSDPRLVAPLLPTTVIDLGDGIVIGLDRVLLVVIVAFGTALLWYLYRSTRFGLATTAVAENQQAAAAMGWSPDRIAVTNWAIGGALAALAGILLAPITSLQVDLLTQIVIAAFAGALIAGFSSFPLALLGGLLVGVAQSELTRYVSTPGIGDSVPFLVIIAVLIVRGKALPVRGQFRDRLPTVGTGRIRATVVVPLVAVMAVLLCWVLPFTWVGAITTSLVVGTILLSLVVLTGYCGQVSLAQYALAGVGALIAGRLVQSAGFSFLPALIVGVLATIPVGMLFAVPALRARGANLAVASLGVGLAVFLIVFTNPDIVGGVEGTRIGQARVFGIDVSAAHPNRYAVIVLVGFVVATLAVANVRRGQAGRRLIAVRENERAAAALGINVFAAKVYAFGLSAGIAALGGILLAFQGSSIIYTGFGMFESINAVSFTVIGGIGYLAGPVLGSTLVPGGVGQELLLDHLTSIDRYIGLLSGLLLLVVILQNPDGMVKTNLDAMRALGRRVPRLRPRERRTSAHSALPAVAKRAAGIAYGERGAPLLVKGVVVRFGGVVAVDNVSLSVAPGEVTGLIGPNGAGKTTMIDAISGFVRPAAGMIVLDGQPIHSLAAHRRARLGVVRSFQSLELFEEMTVLENLTTAGDSHEAHAYLTSLVASGRNRLGPVACAAIEEFGLHDDLERFPRELPYGRRRLVGIARVVATSPRIIILDEPAAGLDDYEATELGDLIRTLASRWGIGVLLIEHNVELVMRVCDRITVLDFGKQIAEGAPADIRRDPRVKAAYLGVAEAGPDDVGGPAGMTSTASA